MGRIVGRIETRLQELGITLPAPAAPVANYVPFVSHGGLVTISGQLCLGPEGKLAPEHVGTLGAGIEPDVAKAAARLCAINLVAQLRAAVGDLDQVVRCIRLGGFIASTSAFTGQAGVMNGASNLMVEIFGDAGRHARSTIGVSALPLGACVEVEGLFALE